ncbi:MAG TPA: DUF4331 domain-containing protein [Verrucomicrobiae bacterium]|nr:DUF4331 domain-containing protein [Verrucomicrobiae bacterium]
MRNLTVCAATAGGLSVAPLASSHREAPMITETPKLDATDFYMFNSYEPGREDFVTLVANYIPLQDAYGGPNFFTFDTNALYEIHIDNNGDNAEDLTFQFRFQITPRNIALPIGPEGNRRTNAVPVLAVGPIGAGNIGALNLDQTYTINLIKGPRRTGAAAPLKNAGDNSTVFTKPLDNVGLKTIPDYNAYANSYMYAVNIPDCPTPGRVFVGQRKDPFVVNLGETFDLINISTSPLGPPDANKDILSDKNVTSMILEVPKSCLLSAPDKPIIGAWITASKLDTNGVATQVSRLGQPLVNEVVIGLKDKDKFNASEPKDDGQFADYVTYPTLPAIIELLYGSAGVKAPTKFPRTDLVSVFLTGLDGLNKNGGASEMLRLNTSTAPTLRDQQKNLGAVAGDLAGFPNGRRPGDDVVDIALRAVMGVLLSTNDAPSGQLPFTDGAYVDSKMFLPAFPYINPPLAGSPNDPTVEITVKASAQAAGPYRGLQASFNAQTHSLEVPKQGPAEFVQTSGGGRRVILGEVKSKDENTLEVKIASP